MRKQLRGTGVALITPFKEDLSIDYAALDKLIYEVIREGVNYLVVLGTTAETPTLSTEEKKELLSFVLKAANHQVPVICGVGGNNTAEVLEQLHSLDLSEVFAVLSVAPYYNKPSQEGLYQHFRAVAEASEKPVILYNVPGRTSSNLLPETVLKLAADCPNIQGIKEASGDIQQCMELIKNRPNNFTVLSGDDALVLAQLAIGMDGIISVAANCFTRDFTYLINAALINKFDRARQLHYKLLDGMSLLFSDGNPAGVKAILSEMGICKNVLRRPLTPVSGETSKKIQEFLKTM